jgi:hypothetical protein
MPALLDPSRFGIDLASDLRRDLNALQPGNPFSPTRGPLSDSTGVTRLAGVLEVFGELFVLFEVGTRRQGSGVRHTNLLSLACLESAQIRLKEGS